MAKIDLNEIKGGFNLSQINANFDKIETNLNEKVLYRDNPVGEPNQMKTDLDMNQKRIYNLPEPLLDHEPARKIDLVYSQGGVDTSKFVRVADTNILPLPNVVDRRNMLLGFNDDGQPYAVAPTTDSATALRQELSSTPGNFPANGVWAPVPQTQFLPTASLSKQAEVLANRTELLRTNVQQTLVDAKAYTDAAVAGAGGGVVAENALINGGFDVWSLGSSITVNTHLQRICDGWNYDCNGTFGSLLIQTQQVSPTLYQPGFNPRYCARVRQTTAGSGNTFQDFSSHIEGARTFAGQTVTISFWAISNSGVPSTMTAVKTEQYFGSGGAPSAPKFNTSSPITIGTTWQRYSVTFTMAALTGVVMGNNADDTLNVILTLPLNQTFDISFANVQINRGSSAAPFQYVDPGLILAKTRRRIYSSYNDQVRPGTITNSGVVSFIATHANMLFNIHIPNGMRSVPHTALYNPATGAANTWNNQGTAVPVVTNTVGMRNVTISVTGCTPGSFVEGHYFLSDPML